MLGDQPSSSSDQHTIASCNQDYWFGSVCGLIVKGFSWSLNFYGKIISVSNSGRSSVLAAEKEEPNQDAAAQQGATQQTNLHLTKRARVTYKHERMDLRSTQSWTSRGRTLLQKEPWAVEPRRRQLGRRSIDDGFKSISREPPNSPRSRF
jgi:hypothetical protein